MLNSKGKSKGFQLRLEWNVDVVKRETQAGQSYDQVCREIGSFEQTAL